MTGRICFFFGVGRRLRRSDCFRQTGAACGLPQCIQNVAPSGMDFPQYLQNTMAGLLSALLAENFGYMGATGAPQALQNRLSASSATPHLEQRPGWASTGRPQLLQNRASGAIGVPQCGQQEYEGSGWVN